MTIIFQDLDRPNHVLPEGWRIEFSFSGKEAIETDDRGIGHKRFLVEDIKSIEEGTI